MLGWVRIPSVWEGKRVFVIGGGPSAKSVDWKLLWGKPVLACNAAAFLLPSGLSSWAVFGDKLFLKNFRRELHAYVELGGILVNATGRPIDKKNDWMLHVKRHNGSLAWGIILPDPKCPTAPTELAWNRSTGGCAINLAAAMGAKEIVLIGFDMKCGDSGHNWHSAYDSYYKSTGQDRMPCPDKNIYKSLLSRPFLKIAEGLDKAGIKCWNASLDSELTEFPKLNLLELI